MAALLPPPLPAAILPQWTTGCRQGPVDSSCPQHQFQEVQNPKQTTQPWQAPQAKSKLTSVSLIITSQTGIYGGLPVYHFLQPSPPTTPPPVPTYIKATSCPLCCPQPGSRVCLFLDKQVSFHRTRPVGDLTSQAPPKQNTIQLRNGISLCPSPQQPFPFQSHQSQCTPPSARPVPPPHQQA